MGGSPSVCGQGRAFWALHLAWAVMSAAGLPSCVASDRENPGGRLSRRLQSCLAVGSVLLGCSGCSHAHCNIQWASGMLQLWAGFCL